MDIDNLKDAWGKDIPQDLPLPSADVLKAASRSAVSRIRKNMKKEFIATLAANGVLLLIFFLKRQNAFSTIFFTVSMFILFMQMIYFFLRFYHFYKASGRYDLGMRQSIQRIVYELELNIEIYKTTNFCAVALALVAGLSCTSANELMAIAGRLSSPGAYVSAGAFITIFVLLLISQAATSFFINIHVKTLYGRHLDTLKLILADLDKEA